MEKVVCEICDKSFKTNESLNQHKNVAHGQSVSAPTKRKRKLAKGKIIGVLAAILIMSGIGYFSFTPITGKVVEPGIYDAFAQCLTENGAVFYGAYWCPKCKEQNELFGSSIKFVTYVECDPRGKNAQSGLCLQNNIQGYPTWIINGKKYEGMQSLERLSELTGCELLQ